MSAVAGWQIEAAGGGGDAPDATDAIRFTVRLRHSDGRTAETAVDIVGTVVETGNAPEDTKRAWRTKGKSAVKDALADGGDPPGRIICSTSGCRVAE